MLADRAGWRPDIPSVTVANEAGGYAATRHLLAGDCRQVAFIAEAPHDPNFKLRRQGCLRAHAERDLEVQPERMQAGRLGPDGRYLVTRKLLAATPFDTIFAANDAAAFGALRALTEAKVPNEVAVVGFADIDLARYSHPPLSTYRCHAESSALKPLPVEVLSGNTPGPLELPVSLIVRLSSPLCYMRSFS